MHDLEAVRYLVEKGANVDASAQGKYPPLMAALARRGEDKSLIGTIARYLIDRGADVNAKARAGETTPLILAVQNQLADVVLALLARGADPNAKSSAGDTPLTSAIPRPDASIAVSLIDRGADVNLAGPSGGLGQGVPLGLAVQAKNAGLVRALLAKGADPNAPKNPSPLTLATGNAEIVKLLTDAGAKP
jgi:ankyrin repeat protein